jgi:hypothetical protein
MADRVLKEGGIPPSAEPNRVFNLKEESRCRFAADYASSAVT